MPLGMEVGLSPGDFVLDGIPALPSPKIGAEPPSQFPAHFCVRWEPSPFPKLSAHVYYRYYDFVTTLHKTQWLLVYSSSS